MAGPLLALAGFGATAAIELAVAQTTPVDAPLSWLASLGAFVPAAAALWYLYLDVRKDRDRYRDIVFGTLPEYRDALRVAAQAQEKAVAVFETSRLREEELVKIRRLLDRLSRRGDA